jgi:23S rRNA (uracil1939-C5)-methyltransferase
VEEETSGETFTVSRIVPGERATLVRYLRGGRRVPVADRILEPSPHRVVPACPHYARCTGCDLLHVTEEEEARYKALTIREVLSRFAGVEVGDVPIVGGTHRGEHRARAAFNVSRDPVTGALAMGLRGFDGTVPDMADCPANRPEVTRVAVAVRSLLEDRVPATLPERVEIGEGVEGTWVVLEREALPADALEDLARAIGQVDGVAAVGLRARGGDTRCVVGVWPSAPPVGGIEFEPAPDAWTQPTPDRATALYAWVTGLGLHHGRRVLDATCGAGGLSIALARMAREVVGVDANWAAVQSATASAARLGVDNASFRGGKIGTVAARLEQAGERFDVTLVNPMRVSLGDEVMGTLARITAGTLLYLAPAPRAGAEDVGALVKLGWRVGDVAAVNLHPGTAKVMMAVVLTAGSDEPQRLSAVPNEWVRRSE